MSVFYKKNHRTFPWRATRNAYKIFISEVMLQQTHVDRVRKKYPQFLKEFPSFFSIASASPRHVLASWNGLGYNRRALNLKAASEMIVNEYGGHLPRDRGALEALPGVGVGTSGSLMAFVYNEPVVFIETNIRRVFLYHFFRDADRAIADREIMPLVEKTLDIDNPREWYYALMDYGSWLGKTIVENPNKKSAVYRKQGAFHGSRRELRGRILKYALSHGGYIRDIRAFSRAIKLPEEKIREVYAIMAKEGFFPRSKKRR